MTSERDPAAWPVIVGTARGSAHVSRQLPIQDSVGSGAVAGGAGVVVAVADGHGAARHFRSATGSALAVQAACAVAGELTAEASLPWDAGRAEALRDELPAAIVDRWRALVDAHLATDPYTPEEQAGLDLRGDGPDIPYGSTLITALIAGDWLVCAQIGDGDLVAVAPDGGVWAPVRGDAHLDGYRTTSLCQPNAVGSFRAGCYDLRSEPLLALLLSTDGYGNAQVSDPWQPAFARDLAELAAHHGRRWFEHQIPLWAQRCASAEGSGDDTTIALLLAPDSLRLAAAGQAARAHGRAGDGRLPAGETGAFDAAPGEAETVLPDGIAGEPDPAEPGAAPSPWAPQSPAARRRAAEAQRPHYSSGGSPPAPHRPPPGPVAPHRPHRRRLTGRRGLLAAAGVVVLAAAGVTGALLATQSAGPAPAVHPASHLAPSSGRPSSSPSGSPRPALSPAGAAATAPVKRSSPRPGTSASSSPAGRNEHGQSAQKQGN